MSANRNPLPGNIWVGDFLCLRSNTWWRRLSLLLLNNNTVSFCMMKN
nr:MAG TPA: hypothetical protein [Caudoviricetes sp.]